MRLLYEHPDVFDAWMLMHVDGGDQRRETFEQRRERTRAERIGR